MLQLRAHLVRSLTQEFSNVNRYTEGFYRPNSQIKASLLWLHTFSLKLIDTNDSCYKLLSVFEH